tara:strand:+ start:35007 stop:36179 length:1173 start_codon:yes stop_codon:yes gene_type:complete
MRDVTENAGGRISREQYILDIQTEKESDTGQTVAIQSLKSSAFSAKRLESAGLTTVKMGNNIDEIWTIELAESAQNGTMGGGATVPVFTGLVPTANTIATASTTTSTTWLGIEVADIDDYPENLQLQVVKKSTGYAESNNELLKLSIAFKEGFDVITEGPTGCGKTMAFQELSFRTQRPLIRINCRDGLEWEDMVGVNTIGSDGKSLEFVEGPLTLAMRHGGIFYADEFNYSRPSVMGGLNMVMDSRTLVLTHSGEILKAHSDFRVVASYNEGYAGTNEINGATKDRFSMGLSFYYLNADMEAYVIQAQTGIEAPVIAGQLVKFANILREMRKTDEIGVDVSTRSLVTTMRILSHMPIKEALELKIFTLFDKDELDTVISAARMTFPDFS